jgi:hypothetical protein
MLTKQCSKCKEVKAFECFSPDNRVPSGCQSRCKFCVAENKRQRHAADPEHFRRLVAESTKRHYAKKIQRNNNYRAKNPEKVAVWKKKDRINNKPRINSDCAMRRAKITSKLTPEINQVYALRDFYIAMSLGDKFHVDHITPLAAGGKHCHTNLRVIPAIDNLRKGAN